MLTLDYEGPGRREDTDAGRRAWALEAAENAAHVASRVGSASRPTQSFIRSPTSWTSLSSAIIR